MFCSVNTDESLQLCCTEGACLQDGRAELVRKGAREAGAQADVSDV